MMEFVFPSNKDDLELPQGDHFGVSNKTNVEHIPPKRALDMVDEVSGRIDNSCIEITEQESFDLIYSFATSFSKLDARTKSSVVRAVSSGLSTLVSCVTRESKITEDSQSSRNAVKMYVYLTCAIISDAEAEEKASSMLKVKKRTKKKRGKEEIWNSHAELLAATLADVLGEGRIYKLWRMSQPDSCFVDTIFKTLCQMLENSDNLKCNETKTSLFSCLASLTTRCPGLRERLVPAMLHMLHNFEFLAKPMADFVAGLANTDKTMVTEIMREVGRLDAGLLCRDSTAAKSLSLFIEELADQQADLVLSSLSLLLSHLDGESYIMRNGVVSVIGSILEAKSRQNQIAGGVSKPQVVDHEEEDQENDNSALNVLTSPMKGKKKPSPVPSPRNDVDEDAARSASKWATVSGSLVQILKERVHDTSSYTRSKALQVWTSLAKAKALSQEHVLSAVEVAVDRLKDKAVQVRKRAIALLTVLLQYNPFGHNLAKSHLEMKILALQQKLKSKLVAAPTDTVEEGQAGDAKTVTKEVVVEIDEDTASELRSVSGAMEFLKRIGGEEATEGKERKKGAMEEMCQLLNSKTSSDALEAIRFFLVANQFHLESAELGIKNMLSLVWSREQNVREEVINAYRQLYLESLSEVTGVEAKRHAVVVAGQLIQLVSSSTLAESTSLSEVMYRLAISDRIPKPLVDALRAIVMTDSQASALQNGALQLLGMLGSAKPSWILSHLGPIANVGLGKTGEAFTADQLTIAATACSVVQKVAKAQMSPAHTRVMSHVFDRLTVLLLSAPVEDAKAEDGEMGDPWYPAAEQALSAIFALHSDPNDLCQRILRRLTATVFGGAGGAGKGTSHASRLFFIAGHTAVKLLVHLERTESVIRKARANGSHSKKASNADAKEGKAGGNIEEDLAVGASKDYELEVVRETVERGLLARNTVFGKLLPALLEVCSSPLKYPGLVSAAVMCLCKLMCVSPKFCEANLQLLFTLLKKSENVKVRANLVVAIGDMAFRFPNLVEPWSSHLYARLDDSSDLVRKNTLMVLMHLILNDMIKIKGPISEISKRLYDKEPRIANLVRVLFSELSHKGKNPIYNLLPDTLSRLSSETSKGKLPREQFRGVLQFLLGFITKEKHAEALVEKLCHRFKASEEQNQWVDLAYCLAQLHYTDKVIKKLIQLYPLYKERLDEPEVLAQFEALQKKARKFAKQDTKQLLDMFAAKLAKGADADGEIDVGVEMKKPSRSKPKPEVKARARRPRRGKAKKQIIEESDEDESVEELSEDSD